MGDLKASVIMDLHGNMIARARRYGDAITTLSRRGNAGLNKLNAGWKRHGKTLSKIGNRYTAIIGVGATAAAVKNVTNLDARLTRLQTNGRATKAQIAELKKELFDVATDPSIRIGEETLLAGFEQIIEDTGDFKNAKKNLRVLGTFIQATGAAGKDAGSLMSIAFKNGVRDSDGMLKVLGIMFKQTTRGSVGIPKFAASGKGIIAPLAAAMGGGPQSISEAGAVAQIAIDINKSADETATAMKAFTVALRKPENVKLFKNAGIDILREGTNFIRRPTQLIPEIYNLIKGDTSLLQPLFGDTGVTIFQGFGLPGNDKALQELSQLTADGSLLKQNARINALTAKAGLSSLGTKFNEGSGEALSDFTKDLADATDTFERTDAVTNTKAIAFALKESILSIPAPVPLLIDGVRDLFADEFKATVHIKVDGSAKVTNVNSTSRNLNVEVDTGLQMVNE